MGGDQQAHQQDQRDRDQDLRRNARLVVMDAVPGRAARRAASLRLQRPGCTWRDLQPCLLISP
jgi:hypothetical protein